MSRFKQFILLFSFCLIYGFAANSYAQSSDALSDEEYRAWATELWSTIDQQTGDITLANAVATLHVPDDFFYLNPQAASTVLVDVWGNPPGQNTLGMLMPAGVTPFEPDSWAVTISYEEDGYVSDDDAENIDYADMLSQMKDEIRVASVEREKQGYGAIELVGWAEQPFYDKTTHKMYWAKELRFGHNTETTLNYNIRVLGRKGVLVLNFIAGMQQKALIDERLSTVLAMAEFDQGSRYIDFDPDIDTVAAYGIGALVAGKVIAKTGFLAVILIFLKKFGIIILIAGGAFVKKIFTGRSKAKS